MTVREARQTAHLARIEPGGDDLQGRPARLGKTTHKLLETTPAQPVTCRMREHGIAAGTQNPPYGLLQSRPLAGDIAHAAACQKTLKGRRPIAGMPPCHEPVGDMDTAHDPVALQDCPRITETRRFQGLDDSLSTLQTFGSQPQ